jgi:hypothetical protein
MKKTPVSPDEKMVHGNWLLRRDGALCCGGVGSTTGRSLKFSNTSGPELADSCRRGRDNSKTRASGYARCKST